MGTIEHQMGDEEEQEPAEVIPSTSLTKEVAATGVGNLRDIDHLGFGYTKLVLRGGLKEETPAAEEGEEPEVVTKRLIDLEHLPKLKYLEIVDLGDNLLEDVKAIGKLSSLLSLKLDTNQIMTIENLPPLANLQLLDLSNNKLTSVDAIAHPMLMYLSLNNNQLEALPDLIDMQCPNIRTLRASGNKITTTSSVMGLKQLELLDLSMNAITELKLGPQEQLEMLELSGNQIKDLEGLTEAMPMLKECNLKDNAIADVKNMAHLTTITTLTTLTFAGCPVCEVGQFRNFVHAIRPGLATLDGEPYAEEDLEPPPPPPEPEPEPEPEE